MTDENAKTAEAMRQYIVAHLADEGLTADAVAAAIGYSRRNADRLFRQATGMSVGGYIRSLRLTEAAQAIQASGGTILDTALGHHYDSHEGFSRAFTSAFGITPRAYRKGGRAIPFFIPYPVSLPESFFRREDEDTMENIVTAVFTHRPRRKLIVLHSETGTDYWSFCQEKGCDWEGLLLSLPERLDTPAFLSLPPALIPPGCALGAVGVEVPRDFAGEVPAGYVVIDLPEGDVLYLKSEPYENENDFPKMIGAVFAAYESFEPEREGFAFDETLPVMNFGASCEGGARLAVMLRRL